MLLFLDGGTARDIFAPMAAVACLQQRRLAAISTVAKRRDARKDDTDARGQCKFNHTSADNKAVSSWPGVAVRDCRHQPMERFYIVNWLCEVNSTVKPSDFKHLNHKYYFIFFKKNSPCSLHNTTFEFACWIFFNLHQPNPNPNPNLRHPVQCRNCCFFLFKLYETQFYCVPVLKYIYTRC